jgi:K+-sensing histidine kinase KdpD
VTRELGDLEQVVAEAVDTFQMRATDQGIALSVTIREPLPPAMFDAARILQVLINLLSNAVKFTPPGGEVSVRVECSASELLCAVSDTGAGIPSDKLETVFQRFLQLARKDRRGVGLGLYRSASGALVIARRSGPPASPPRWPTGQSRSAWQVASENRTPALSCDLPRRPEP